MQENTQEKSPIKQRILIFLTKKGMTPYEFYKQSGVTRGVLAQNNGISEDNLMRFISLFPEVNIVWLITGAGEMVNTGDDNVPKKVTKQEISDMQENTQEISKHLVNTFMDRIEHQSEKIGEMRREILELKRQLQTFSSVDGVTSQRSALA